MNVCGYFAQSVQIVCTKCAKALHMSGTCVASSVLQFCILSLLGAAEPAADGDLNVREVICAE